MSQRRSNRGRGQTRSETRGDAPQFQRGPEDRRDPQRDPQAAVSSPDEPQLALPAPGTATAVASGAAGPPRPVLPYDRREPDDLDDRYDGDGNGPLATRGHAPRDPSIGDGHGNGEDIPTDLKQPGAFWV